MPRGSRPLAPKRTQAAEVRPANVFVALDADVGHGLGAGRGHEVANVVEERGQDGVVVVAPLRRQVCSLEAVLCASWVPRCPPRTS